MKLWLVLLVNEFQANPSRQQSVKTSQLKAGTYTADGKPHMVQQHPITCLDGLTNVEYQPGDEWTQTRIFDNGPTTGMEGQFRCECQQNGGITCRSLSLPCIFAERNKGYQIGEKFVIKDYGDSHVDFQCACIGEANGKIDCTEINPGCWDTHTQKKYPLNTEFEQTRAGDDLIRDCVCSGDDKSRLVSCQLKRYCKLNGKYIKLNEQEVIETETQKQTCTCIEAARTSCIIEAKPITKKNQYQIPEETILMDELDY